MRTHGERRKHKPRKKSHEAKALRRKIHLSSGVWSWECDRGDITIRTPDNSRDYEVSQETLTGMTCDQIERANWKCWGNRPANEGGKQITPAVVKQWIEENYL